jgi:hypothetical protein
MLDIVFGTVVVGVGIVLKFVGGEAISSVERVAVLIGVGLVAGVIGKTHKIPRFVGYATMFALLALLSAVFGGKLGTAMILGGTAVAAMGAWRRLQ